MKKLNHSLKSIIVVLFIISQSIFSQELNDLTSFAYFHEGAKTDNATLIGPMKEFDSDSKYLLEKYSKYFSEIGWNGICTIPADWYFTSGFGTGTKDSWKNVISNMQTKGMNDNFVKISIGINNRWTNNQVPYFLPLWNDNSKWSVLWTIFDEIGDYANYIGATGVCIDNEQYRNKLLWTYYIDNRSTLQVNNFVIDLSSTDIKPGTICRVVKHFTLPLDTRNILKYQWLACAQNENKITLSDDNYVYVYQNENPSNIINSGDNVDIYTEPYVEINSSDHGSIVNGNYFVRFDLDPNLLYFNEECHVIYHNPNNNRHYEWIANTNPSGSWGEVILKKEKEINTIRFTNYRQATTGINRIFLNKISGIIPNRFCKITYDNGSVKYCWLTYSTQTINKPGVMNEMMIETDNNVGINDESAPSSFYADKHLDHDDFTIESLGGGVEFGSTGVGTIGDGKYWIWGIPNVGDNTLHEEMPCKVVYYEKVNPSNPLSNSIRNIAVWDGDFLFNDEHDFWEIRLYDDNLNQDLSTIIPDAEWYEREYEPENFQVCLDFDYDVDHNTNYFSLFSHEFVRTKVKNKAYLIASQLGNNVIFAPRIESYRHDLADDFIQGLIDGKNNNNITIANEQSYTDLSLDLNETKSSILDRFDPDPDYISFGVSPLQNSKQLINPQDFEQLFTNVNAINTPGLNWLYTSTLNYGQDWYFKSLQTGVNMEGDSPKCFNFKSYGTGTPGNEYGFIWKVENVNVGQKVRVIYENGPEFYVWDSVVWPVNMDSYRQIRISPYNAVQGMGPVSNEFYNEEHDKIYFNVYKMCHFNPIDVKNASSGIARKFLYINEDDFDVGDQYHIIFFDDSINAEGHYVYYEWKYTTSDNDITYHEVRIEPENSVYGESGIQVNAPEDFYTDVGININSYYMIYKYLDNDEYISVLKDGNLPESKIYADNNSSLKSNNLNKDKYIIYNNYPNPFNPTTKIKYDLPKPEIVKIEVFNLLGQKIETLLNKKMSEGTHEIEFTARDLPSGVYLYRIKTGTFQEVKKMILLR